jgi:hypothetical protein
MRHKRKILSLFVVVWIASCSTVDAQSGDKPDCPESKQIEKMVDSLTEQLEGREKSVVLFIMVDFQGQKAYGCILKKMDSIITGEKLFMNESTLREGHADDHRLSLNRALIVDFFENPQSYLTPALSEQDKRESSHDNRMFFLAKINGKIVFKRHFCHSDYLSSKNQKLKSLFLKLGDIAD